MEMLTTDQTNEEELIDLKKLTWTYTQCYCEENIYMLCQEIKVNQPELLKYCSVVYISNDNKTVPLWQQKAAVGEQPVIWDYHVVLYFQKGDRPSYIYDYDTLLSFPCPSYEYVTKTFKPEYQLKQQFDRYFRLISADMYLQEFGSDRSHMRKPDGSFHAEPPIYPPIKSAKDQMNLMEYISMKNNVQAKYGMVHSSIEFYKIAIINNF